MSSENFNSYFKDLQGGDTYTTPPDETRSDTADHYKPLYEDIHDEIDQRNSGQEPQRYTPQAYENESRFRGFNHPQARHHNRKKELLWVFLIGVPIILLFAFLLSQSQKRSTPSSRTNINNSKVQSNQQDYTYGYDRDGLALNASGDFIRREEQSYDPEKIALNKEKKSEEDLDNTTEEGSDSSSDDTHDDSDSSVSLEASHYVFDYPTISDNDYISGSQWPPQLSILKKKFECNSSEGGTRTTIGSKEFCIIQKKNESITSYVYETPREGMVFQYEFSFDIQNCSTLAPEKAVYCQVEQGKIKPNDVAFEVANTTRLK